MQAANEALVIVRQAGRLLLGYWPTLLVLAFAGMTVRYGMFKLAVLAGGVHPLLGTLVFAFVPLGLLVALVLMFVSMRRTLPSVADLDRGRRPAITDLASVLLPFLVIYAALDLYADDRPELVLGLDWWLAGVVAGAAVLRGLLGLRRRRRRRSRRYVVAAALDVVWLTLAAVAVFLAREQVMNRRVVEWAGELLPAAVSVVLIPLAWLAFGAVVYARRLPGPDLSRRARPRWMRLPRRWRSGAGAGFGALRDGLRLLGRGSPVTLGLVGLVFALVQFVPVLLFLAQRALIGPRDPVVFWLPLSSVLGAVNVSVGMIVLVCLVASAVNRWLELRRDDLAGQVEADVSGELFGAGYPYAGRDGVAWRDEENEGLVPV